MGDYAPSCGFAYLSRRYSVEYIIRVLTGEKMTDICSQHLATSIPEYCRYVLGCTAENEQLGECSRSGAVLFAEGFFWMSRETDLVSARRARLSSDVFWRSKTHSPEIRSILSPPPPNEPRVLPWNDAKLGLSHGCGIIHSSSFPWIEYAAVNTM